MLFTWRSEVLWAALKLPETVILYWDDQELGSVPCVLAKCVPLKVFHTLQDPTLYYPKPSTPPDRFKIAGSACSALAYAAIFLFGAGVVSQALAFMVRDLDSQVWFTSGLCAVLLGSVCGFLWARLPHREVWVELASGQVTVYSGARLPGVYEGRDRKCRSLRDFSHVRIVEMECEASAHVTDWCVSLEEPIYYASSSGVVERRRGVELETLGSHLSALHYAARIGTHLGLKILDTGRSWS
jgi:hypothetical protein